MTFVLSKLPQCLYSTQVLKAIFRKLAEAIIYVNNQGIAHCDIKTGNILINENLSPLLIDWGLSLKITAE